MEENKQPQIRNASGISAYDKQYYKDYASKKTKEMVYCDVCLKDISYYAKSKHFKSKRHLANLENKN